MRVSRGADGEEDDEEEGLEVEESRLYECVSWGCWWWESEEGRGGTIVGVVPSVALVVAMGGRAGGGCGRGV